MCQWQTYTQDIEGKPSAAFTVELVAPTRNTEVPPLPFLTAIAIGPVTVMPDQWLPRIFGSEADEPMPEFPSPKVVRRVIDLIMRLYTSVIVTFEVAPEEFEPTFYARDVDGKTYTIVDEWCSGFLQGIRLTQEAWQPLLEEQPDSLRPFQLFATEEGWAELASAPDKAVMHAEWSNKIAPTVGGVCIGLPSPQHARNHRPFNRTQRLAWQASQRDHDP